MKTSNSILVAVVWAVAFSGLISFLAVAASAQPTWEKSTVRLTGLDDTGSWWMFGEIGFHPDTGESWGGMITVMDADRLPLSTDPWISAITAQYEFNSNTISVDDLARGTFNGGAGGAFFSHRDSGLNLSYSDVEATWVVPEASAIGLILIGLLCLTLGRR